MKKKKKNTAGKLLEIEMPSKVRDLKVLKAALSKPFVEVLGQYNLNKCKTILFFLNTVKLKRKAQ